MNSSYAQRSGSCAAVVVEDMSYEYDRQRAVDHASLEIAVGEVFALLGTNGAGKTTTLETIQGYRRPTSGRVEVFGLDPVRDGQRVRRRTGFMLQSAGLIPEQTVGETLGLWSELMSRPDNVDSLLERVELTHRRDVRVDRLSGGELRRLDLATAIWGAPALVVLDEPTTGLDPASRDTLWQLVNDLRRGGSTILLTTHYLEEAQALADTVAIMHAGEVALQGPLGEVLASRPAKANAVIDAAFEMELPSLRTRWSGRREGDTLILDAETRDTHADIRELIQAADRQGLRVHDLTVTKASLEDIFHSVRNRAAHAASEPH